MSAEPQRVATDPASSPITVEFVTSLDPAVVGVDALEGEAGGSALVFEASAVDVGLSRLPFALWEVTLVSEPGMHAIIDAPRWVVSLGYADPDRFAVLAPEPTLLAFEAPQTTVVAVTAGSDGIPCIANIETDQGEPVHTTPLSLRSGAWRVTETGLTPLD